MRRIFFIFFGAPWLSMNARYEKNTKRRPWRGGLTSISLSSAVFLRFQRKNSFLPCSRYSRWVSPLSWDRVAGDAGIDSLEAHAKKPGTNLLYLLLKCPPRSVSFCCMQEKGTWPRNGVTTPGSCWFLGTRDVQTAS